MEELNHAIGGYFGLELRDGSHYHENAVALNTGRNALEYILRVRDYRKIYLPFFTCDVLLEPVKKLNIRYEFYNIDLDLEPVFDFGNVENDSCFLYTNYFGLKDLYITDLVKKCNNLIIDNAQSFYSKPEKNTDTFYSARKFFGVPDGSYLYCDRKIDFKLSVDSSSDRFAHLLERVETGAEAGYSAFIENDKKLENQPILEMSTITRTLLKSIDYKKAADIRIQNFLYLDRHLKSVNKFKFNFNSVSVPMVYPLWFTTKLREYLINHKIYVAKYWPNIIDWCSAEDLEFKLSEEVSYLPIDQRYSRKEMDLIINIIKSTLNDA